MKRTKSTISEQWYLLRWGDGIARPEGQTILRQLEYEAIDLDVYQQEKHTHPIIQQEFQQFYASTVLVRCDGKTLEQLTAPQERGAVCFHKIAESAHSSRKCLQLTGDDAEQVLRLLRIKADAPIEITRRILPPTGFSWKKCCIRQGPLQGLRGEIPNDRANHRKFFFTILPKLQLRFLIPAIQFRKTTSKALDFHNYVDPCSYWFILSCRTEQHLQYAFLDEENPLQKLDINHLPDPDNQERILYNPEFISNERKGKVKHQQVFRHHYFLHTTLSDIETFRLIHPDSHVYVMRDRHYNPLRITSVQMQEFIQTVNYMNGIVTESDQSLIQELRPGDVVQFNLLPQSEPILGGIQRIKGSHGDFIILTPSGLITIHKENILLTDEQRVTLQSRKG